MLENLKEVEVVEEVATEEVEVEVKVKPITKREALTLFAKGELTEEAQEWAANEIYKIDVANAKRKEKPTKAQIENAPLLENIVEFLGTQEEAVLAATVAENVDMTQGKAVALLRMLSNQGVVDNTGFNSKGTKLYKLAE